MGATLTDDVPVANLIEPSGYNIPADLIGKTWGDVKASGDVTLVELEATENKVYTPDEGKAYKKVTVNVPVLTLEELSATENKVYTPDEGKAYSKVTVNVPAPTVKLSAWKNETNIVYTKTAEPTTSDKALVPAATGLSEAVIAAVADAFASITIGETTYTRYSDGDVTVA